MAALQTNAVLTLAPSGDTCRLETKARRHEHKSQMTYDV
jgi:hypothetical protein